MSDARQDEGNGGSEPDIAIEEEQAAAAPAQESATPPSGTPLSKFAAPPPPAAGQAPVPNGVTTPKPGSLKVETPKPETPKPETPVKSAVAVTEPAPAEAAVAPTVVSAPAPAAVTGDGLHVVFAGMTSVGLVREHNEDNLVIADLGTKQRMQLGETIASTVGSAGALFSVCDGMGGAAAGEVASQMAVDFLFEEMAKGDFGGDRDTLARHLVSVVERAGKQIFDTAQADRSRRGMGTTSTVAVLIDKVLFVAQVGDSRAYILRNGVLKQVTKDQSLVNQLIEAGHLTEEEAEAFEHSNIILQALGTAEKVQVDLTFVELRQSDRLMMCSDGLSGLMHAETIAETMRTIGDPIACCTRLTELANEGGGHDNITVIVADFTGSALSPPQSGDVAGYNQYPLLPEGASASVAPGTTTDGGKSTVASGTNAAANGGVWQWWAMGLVAILVGVAMAWWWENKQAPPQDEPVLPAAEPTVMPEQGAAPGAAEEFPEPELVPVHIATDAEAGLLLVNGEPHGPLAVGAPRDLDLPPGSYRIELQIEGSVAVSQLVTVESGKPLDIELSLPSGAVEVAEDEPEPAAIEPAPAARRARPPVTETVEPTETAKVAPVKVAPVKVAPNTTAPNTTAPSTTKAPTKRELPSNPF